jgi:hypothetical protein
LRLTLSTVTVDTDEASDKDANENSNEATDKDANEPSN